MIIKSRKYRESEYDTKYGGVSTDAYTRLSQSLGKKFNEENLNKALDRIQEIKNISYSAFRIIFYEVPIQAHRPRAAFKQGSIYSPNAKANFNSVSKFLSTFHNEYKIVATPMKIILDAYLPMPSGLNPVETIVYESKNAYGIGKPDFDNIIKAYCDMIQKNLILDDDLVVSSEFNKYFSLKPRVELTIIFQDGTISENEYKKIIHRKEYTDLGPDVMKIIPLVKPYSKKKH